MMEATRREPKLNSSIHQNIRSAEFVELEFQEEKKFKYNYSVVRLSLKKRLDAIKHQFTKLYQRIDLWCRKVDWKIMFGDMSLWLLEALVEGFVANFVTHHLFGMKFTPATVLAHGFLIKQGISVFWRLRIQQHGPITELSKKQ